MKNLILSAALVIAAMVSGQSAHAYTKTCDRVTSQETGRVYEVCTDENGRQVFPGYQTTPQTAPTYVPRPYPYTQVPVYNAPQPAIVMGNVCVSRTAYGVVYLEAYLPLGDRCSFTLRNGNTYYGVSESW